jgi:hypothetical protein
MATTRMINLQDLECLKPLKQLTLRDRGVINNILEEYVGKDTSEVISIIGDYLKHREVEYVGSKILQDDDKWLRVDVLIGDFAKNRSTTYSFKRRHPNNPQPAPLA